MHIAEGFISGGTPVGVGLTSAAAGAVAVRHAGRALGDRRVWPAALVDRSTGLVAMIGTHALSPPAVILMSADR